VGVRRLDHINYLGAEVAPNRDYLRDVLGAMVTEQIVLDDGATAGTAGPPSPTRGMTPSTPAIGPAWPDGCTSPPRPTPAPTSSAPPTSPWTTACSSGPAPHKHAVQQTFLLYVYKPGGNRIELCNAGTRLVLAPDWRTVNWTEAERAKGQARRLKTIESFHTHGTSSWQRRRDNAQLLDLLGSQFGSQGTEDEHTSYFVADAEPHPATSSHVGRHSPHCSTPRRSNCSQAVNPPTEVNFEKTCLPAPLRPERDSNARPTA
jgi:hypothetical protein